MQSCKCENVGMWKYGNENVRMWKCKGVEMKDKIS